MVKISILGDVLCEAPFFRAAQNDGAFNFASVFEGLKAKCAQSDYVIANLETPIAGAACGYVDDGFTLYSMNAPVELPQAVKDAGIDFVLTANNHCCDRGIDGLIRTLDALDAIGLPHTGTFRNAEESRVAYVDVGEIKIAILACTASTNEFHTGLEPTMEHVNLLKTQIRWRKVRRYRDILSNAKIFLRNQIIGTTKYTKFIHRLGKPMKPIIDSMLDEYDIDQHLAVFFEQIRIAKEKADLVLVCPHMGGQFNVVPGAFSEYVMNCLSAANADAVIGAHPHIVQKSSLTNGVPCIYSLGNTTMSLNTMYIIHDDLPDYGIMAHFYVENKKISKVTYSIVKICEDEKGYVYTQMLKDVYDRAGEPEREHLLNNANIIAKRVDASSQDRQDVLDEYPLYQL